MHVNPVKSRPLSPEGRDNYDRIFRKSASHSPPAPLEEWQEKQRQRGIESRMEMERALINQKQIDESA